MALTRLLMQVSYDGTDYHGFQKQPNLPSIQSVLEEALEAIHGHPVMVYGASRTDAGVHAYAQFIHFDTELVISLDAWVRAMNANLPLTIRVINARSVHSHFHARYNAHHKQYQYKCSIGAIDPLRIRYVYFIYPTTNIEAIRDAAQVFLGTHDFHNFTANHTPGKDYHRTITKLEVIQSNDDVVFIVEGHGFLHHMVRMIVGTLLEVGKGKITKQEIEDRLHSVLPDTTPWNAPAHGLYLMRTDYNDKETIIDDND